ncbi:ogr/Delta-like zinc finger family protein [Pseudomonas violetae]|uniref:Ogr/Delta-like zinc finger family protein n=1 Tax=Pseudomonas violetae TaxID=2915813 RepID=A0ABT0EV56_9PSED|nr:ogr/Delta-like zinc finger family protein [Pseudomonas violetae]MCK1789634.1 ogr/Delta-like zinc finger family protein [Pseudomonas violetae]
MRVTCKCGNKGLIRDSKKHSPDFVTLYCLCLDVACAHSWVAHLTFSHTVSPSAQTYERMLLDRLRDLPREKQRELFEQLGSQAAG